MNELNDLKKIIKRIKRKLETKGRFRTHDDIKHNLNLNQVAETDLRKALEPYIGKTMTVELRAEIEETIKDVLIPRPAFNVIVEGNMITVDTKVKV